MQELKERYVNTLIIETDQYTGNIDSDLCALLFREADGRMQSERNAEVNREMVSEEEYQEHLSDFLESRPHDEYGMMHYSINNDLNNGYHSLEVYPNEYSQDRVESTVKFLKEKFGDEIHLLTWRDERTTVKILGYHWKVDIIKSSITKL